MIARMHDAETSRPMFRAPTSDGAARESASSQASLGSNAPARCGELPPDMVHDLRNIVAPIKNAVQVIRLRSGADEVIQAMTDTIDRQMDAMVVLLDPKRTEAGRAGDNARDGRELQERLSGSQASPAPASPGIRRRILVADDNAVVRESLTSFLQSLGHEVKTVVDGGEALQLAEQWRPDFVLLDIHMPGPSGFVVARRLRGAFPPSSMQLVMMSGMTLDETWRKGAKEAGFDHCIDKAFDLAILEQLLNSEFRSAAGQPDRHD
jgi:CheY-like chemotaxis protein